MQIHIKFYVKEIRRKRKLTIQQLADKAEIGIATISDIENGNKIPNIGTLIRIAYVLDCKVEDLYKYKVKK